MNETESAPRKKRGRAWLAAGIAVVLVTAAAAGFFWWRSSHRQDSFFDVSALTGALPGKSEEEVIAELNRVVDEGMFNIAINSYITFPDAKGEGVANIENVPGNRYNMTVSIVLDDTGETVYQSTGIKPGQYIQKIRLDEELPEGFYYATAVFTAYAQDEAHTRVGQAAAKIQLEVGG